MNQGQEKFLNFIIERVDEVNQPKVKAIMLQHRA